MMIFVYGKNDSGKSKFAEKLLSKSELSNRVYIATMQPYTDENFIRIQKHRSQREGLGFLTIEAPFGLESISLSDNCAVLLEDVSNLLSNLIFSGSGNDEAAQALREIQFISRHSALFVLVSIDELDANNYSDETAYFITSLNHLNQEIFGLSDVSVKLENGVPTITKGVLML